MPPQPHHTGDRTQGELLRVFIDSIPAMVAYWDRELHCQFANRAYEAWFGRSPSSLLGTHIRDLLGPLYPLNLPYIEGALRGEPQEFERTIPSPTGGPPRQSLATYHPDVVDGVVRGFFVLVTDITKTKALIAAEQAAREREEAARAQCDQLRAAAEARAQFASMVSHDLRNPLGAILLQTRLFRKRLEQNTTAEPHTSDWLSRIERCGSRMQGLLDELLDIARLQGGQPLALNAHALDLAALIRPLVEDTARATTHHAVRLLGAEAPVMAHCDPARMERVLDNLLSNAIKYSPQGGDIDVTLRCTTQAGVDTVHIEVKDQGIGISDADLPHIFDWFSRGKNAALSTRGTGLGLAGAQRIVQQHGGRIDVETREGHGSTFTVVIPRAPQEPHS